jgi:hypothetical protein
MITQRRADFTDFNGTTLGILLLLVFFPIGIFFLILSSSMSGQAKAIVSIVVLIVGFVPLILLGVAFSQAGTSTKKPNYYQYSTTSSVKRTRIIYHSPICKEANIYLKPDLPLCKPGQDPYENKEIIEID